MPKNYYLMMNIGKCKYVVNYHDGIKFHKDGSPFYDISIFKNWKDTKSFMGILSAKGFVKR